MIGIVPRPLHAILDYLWGIAMFFAPELLGFDGNKEACAYCKARGASMVVASLMTRYELGLLKIIPFNQHLAIDWFGGLFGLFAPSVFGFERHRKARQAALAFTVFELAAVLISKRDRKA